MRTPLTLLLLSGALCGAAPAGASLITLPGSYTYTGGDGVGRFHSPNKGKDPGAPVAYVEYIGLTGQISERRATLHVEITLAGPVEGEAKAVGLVPLPTGTAADQVQITVDGAAPTAHFLTPAQATTLYGQISKSTKSTRLLAYAGQPALLIPAMRLDRSQDVDLEMVLPVTQDQGLYTVAAPLLHEGFTRAPAQRLTVALELTAEGPLKGVFSPSHPLQVKRLRGEAARLTANLRAVDGGGELRLFFGVDQDPMGLRVLTHREEGEDQGYFMVLGQPAATGDVQIPKDLVLAIDTSGSMRGEKWSQVQAAALEVLGRLNPGDRFNIVAFGDSALAFAHDPLTPATPDQIAAAKAFLDDLTPNGRTNIAGALALGLARRKADRPHILLLLTDGAPTAGARDPAEILKMIPALNVGGGRVFALGVGHDVNTHLLDQMAQLTEGESHYVVEGEPIDVKVAALTDGLRRPVLTDAKMAWGGLEVEAVYPKLPTELYAGREILMVGRYHKGGRKILTIRGETGAGPAEITVAADFPTKPQSAHEFLAPLWAARRIGDLLRDLRLKGADEEKIAEVVRLSRRFGIFTEYTGFMAQGGAPLDDAAATAQAASLLDMANMKSSGAWAVRQADNEQALRGKKVSSSVANTYVDRRGTVQKAEHLKQVGRRTFYKRDGRWVEADAKKPARKRRVKRFSREYMDLVKENKDFARAQSLDGDLEINLGDESVEVY